MILDKIIEAIEQGNSIILLGCSNTGKSYFINNQLLPILEKKFKVAYFEDGYNIAHKDVDIAIFDEVELLVDQAIDNNLEYIKKVKDWQKKYLDFSMPSIYVVTRNKKSEINYLKKIYKTTEWDGRKVVVIEYK